MNFNFETWGLAVFGIVGVVGHFVNGVRKKGVTWLSLASNTGVAFFLPIEADVMIVYFYPSIPLSVRLGISGVIGSEADLLMNTLTKFLKRLVELLSDKAIDVISDKIDKEDTPNHDTDGEGRTKRA